jgi:hypothetical protein
MCSGTDHVVGQHSTCAFLQLVSRLQCGNTVAGSNTNKRKALLEFLKCYQSLHILWDMNHVTCRKRQKKSEADSKLLRKFKQVEPNSERDTMVWKTSSVLSASCRQLKEVRDWKTMGLYSTVDVYTPSLCYFNKPLLFLFFFLFKNS